MLKYLYTKYDPDKEKISREKRRTIAKDFVSGYTLRASKLLSELLDLGVIYPL